MMLAPFAYADRPQERRHDPCGYDPYNGYKDWLRDEFSFRCVYCLEREMWYPDGAASFSVEHVVPQSENPSLVCEYTNLLYTCTRCNSARQTFYLLDPTTVPFARHLRLGADGLLTALSDEGLFLIDLLHLNQGAAIRVRREQLSVLTIAARYPEDEDIQALFLERFGYPDDMPDLRAKKPPGGNRRSGSEETCHFARRERGELPVVY